MRTSLAGLCLLGLLALPASAQDSVERVVLRADEDRRAAMTEADVGQLDRLLADDLVYVHSNGSIDDKRSLLDSLGSGEVRYRTIQVDEIDVRQYPGGSVLVGRQRIHVTARGEEMRMRQVFTAVYTDAAEGPRLVSYQSTAAPDAP